MIKTLKLDEQGNPIKNESGEYVIEDIDIDALASEKAKALADDMLKQELQKIEDVKTQEKAERITTLEKQLAEAVQAVKGNTGLGAVTESNESDKEKSKADEEPKVSMGYDPHTKTIIGGDE